MRMFARLALPAILILAVPTLSRADEKSHRAAAENLLKVMEVDKQLTGAIDQSLEMQIKANPQIGQFKDVMKKFLNKHMSWESLKDEFIAIYVDAFSESELEDIRAFYLTPTGKKLVSKQPELLSKGMMLGSRRVQENQSELRQMIEEEIAKKKDQ